MVLDDKYVRDLVAEVASGLRAEHGAATVELANDGDGGTTLVMMAGGRTLAHSVVEPVYHYEPDGSDVERHAAWLVQLFDEEAR